MGLFKDKDLRKLEYEITKIMVTLKLIGMGMAPDLQRARAAVNASAGEVVQRVQALRAKGKTAEAEAALANLQSHVPELEEIVAKVRASVRAALGDPVEARAA